MAAILVASCGRASNEPPPETIVRDSYHAPESVVRTTEQAARSNLKEVEQILTEMNAIEGADSVTTLAIPDSVLFDFAKSTLRPEAQATLDRIAKVLVYYANSPVEIHGHTDNIGTDEDNQRLSERRAQAVRDDLVDRGGLDGLRITTKGLGETRPVASNQRPDGSDDADGRQKNRRVEVRFRKGAHDSR